jgi:hypothetical protein
MVCVESIRALGAFVLVFLPLEAAGARASQDGAPATLTPAGPRPAVTSPGERRRPGEAAQRPLSTLRPAQVPASSSAKADLEREKERLRAEIEALRLRVSLLGQAAAERSDPDWWDLPARRRQQRRLRYLNRLRRQLQLRRERLAFLEGRAPGRGEAIRDSDAASDTDPQGAEKEDPDKEL